MFDLRPFQAQAIADLQAGFQAGHRRQILSLSTGAGKTVVAGHVALKARDRGHRALFIVDRIELVTQAARTFHGLGLSVGILRGEDTSYSESDDIIVASIQTISRRQAPDWVKLVMIDECHILHRAHIKLMEDWNLLPFIGLSATPLRPGLGKYFTNLVRGPSVRELIEQGFLVPTRGFAPGADAVAQALQGVTVGSTTHGRDYREKDLSRVMNRKQLVGDIVTTWKERGDDRPTLVFAVDIAHSRSIADDFAAAGVSVAHLDGHTPDDERRRIIDDFRAGTIRVLTSVYVLGIGFDAPEASCLILARPTLSEMLHFQQLGRGIRTAPGKADCLVLDHASNTLKHGLPHHFEAAIPGQKYNIKKQPLALRP
jgi:DNA repair protein RadD